MSRTANRENSHLISQLLSITTLILIALFFIDSSEQLFADGFIQRLHTQLINIWRA